MWEEISIALNLSRNIRQNCKSDKSIISLNNLLNSWVLSGEATLTKLKSALESEVVGAKAVAESLVKTFKPSGFSEKDFDISEILNSHFPCLITYQSSSTVVSDEKSTLLGVQVSHHGSVSYQWMKDDQPLANSSTYLGVHSDILFVNNVGKKEEGNYFCSVSDGDTKFYSDNIKLTVNFSPAKEYVLNLYSKYKDIPPDSWPPSSNTYINLTLLKSSKLCTEAVDYAIQGSADDTVNIEDKISLEIFQKYQSGSLILIEGRPGSGKSTLIQKIVIDWAKGDMLIGAKMVYLIPLRYNNLEESDESLSSLLSQFYYNEKGNFLIEEMENMEKSGGEKICFVIDGLDEYHPKNEKQSVIYKLLWKSYLPQSMVIVSSRPSATAIIKHKAKITECIEVMGFAKEDILNYIERFSFTVSDSNKLKDYLLAHTNVFDMCYLPVHSAIICSLYNEMKGDIPNTETKIYETFIKLIIQHHFSQNSTSLSFHSLEELTKKDDKFERLCFVAFNMIVDSKHAFKQCDIPGGFNKTALFGLVTIDRIIALTNFEETSSFLHVTIQEFLAAVYIAHLNCDEQLQIVMQHKVNPDMVNVWKFFCGLANLSPSHFRELLHYLIFSIDDKDKFLIAVEYVFESQQPHLYSALLELSNGIAFQSHLKPLHITAVCDIVSTSQCSPSKVCLVQHCTNEHGTTRILKCINKENLKFLSNLTLSGVSLGSTGTNIIAERLKYCKQLTELDLSKNELFFDDILGLLQELRHCSCLKALDMSYNVINAYIVELVGELKQVETLNLSYNRISSSGIINMVQELKKTAKTLNLEGNYRIHHKNMFNLISEIDSSHDKIQNLHLSMLCINNVEMTSLNFSSSNVVIQPQRKAMSRSLKGFESHPKFRSFNDMFLYNIQGKTILQTSNEQTHPHFALKKLFKDSIYVHIH